MAKEDSAPGLLSKMVKFVRNPATNWSDLDSVQAEQDESVSKQLLKEMIERKRRNDFVRKREFDMLRKLRKREAMVGAGLDPGERPSFFQSSMPSRPDDRASTIKKIDEIEAQMSMHWWKTKNVNAPDPSAQARLMPQGRGGVTQNPLLDHELPAAYKLTAPMGLPAAPKKAQVTSEQGLLPTVPDSLSVALAASRMVRPRDKLPAMEGLSEMRETGASHSSVFSPSKLTAVDVEEGLAHDAGLEEAAIRFANGDDAGAEAGLLEILGPVSNRTQSTEIWLTLFDFYRATGAQDKFEAAAIEFAERFDRSAPQWFSMPKMVEILAEPVRAAAHRSTADWICPSVLGIQTVAALKAALVKAPMPWRLNWSNLKTIETTAVEPLTKVFSDWAAQPVRLRFMGEAQLQQVLGEATPSGNREAARNGWLLRLEALRVMHQPDDFELTALDFCVTYELSPPAWVSARCEYESIDALGRVVSGPSIAGDTPGDSVYSGLSSMDDDTQFESQGSQVNQVVPVELTGHIQGDAIAVLDKLEGKFVGSDTVLISCGRLVRVDFSAAGALLNWASARQSEKRSVQFLDVNRLVAAFFNVIGITEHATVVVRLD